MISGGAALAGYRARVRGDILRWQREGLIDAPTADALARDVDARAGSGVSFGAILATLAALLFAAGLLLLAAADWDTLPRGLRLGGIAALLFLFLGGGAWMKGRGRAGFAEASWLAASASWGAGIVLVGSMYGVDAEDGTVVLLWCLGTALAAAAFRSSPLTLAAGGLAVAWLGVTAPPLRDGDDFPFAFPLLAGGLWLVSLRTDSRRARDLLLLSFLLFLILLALERGALGVGLAMAGGYGLLFGFAARWPARADALLRLDGHAAAQALLGCFGGLALVQGHHLDSGAFGVSAALFLAAIAAALLVGGRASAGVRRIAYVAFAAELCLVFAVTVGSTLDTVSFFLAAALLLAGLAVVVLRIERRWRPAAETGTRP